jgi:hypothetical protein
MLVLRLFPDDLQTKNGKNRWGWFRNSSGLTFPPSRQLYFTVNVAVAVLTSVLETPANVIVYVSGSHCG